MRNNGQSVPVIRRSVIGEVRLSAKGTRDPHAAALRVIADAIDSGTVSSGTDEFYEFDFENRRTYVEMVSRDESNEGEPSAVEAPADW